MTNTNVGNLPLRLGKAPLIERVFELRFEPVKEGIAELLPGMIYSTLGADYNELESLPIVSVPKEAREKDERFRFLPHYQMRGNNRTIQFGNRTIVFSETRPDGGWSDYQQELVKILQAFEETKFIKQTLRFSLKSISVFSDTTEDPLNLLNLSVQLGSKGLESKGFHLRTEIDSLPDTVTILQVIGRAAVQKNGESSKDGMLIDVDAVRILHDELFWDDKETALTDLHKVQKENFFSLLKESTVNSLDPNWG